MDLLLRALHLEDQPQFVAACQELADEGFEFGMQWRPGDEFAEFVIELCEEESGRGLQPGFVPATFRVAVVGGDLVGRVSVRHTLSPRLAIVNGHIGYAVRPAFRRQGFATEIFRQSLVLARDLGIDSALVTCDEDNWGSREVIRRGGGTADGTAVDDRSGKVKLRFWCPTS